MTVDTMNSVVVASDSLDMMSVALTKAVTIEHYTGADIHVAQAVYDHVADESTETIPAQDKVQLVEALKAMERKGLEDLIADQKPHVASLSTQVLWDKNKSKAILRLVGEQKADLLIKPVSHHNRVTDFLHAPLDWALMRQADCPVLISKQPWPEQKVVLACIDACNEAHETLNKRVLLSARRLADIVAGQLHIVTVFPDLGQRVDGYQVATDFDGMKADMKERREKHIAGLIEEHHLNATAHVLAGNPAAVICHLASTLAAAVTVVGTAARSGLAKVFVGNTAEDLFGQLTGDVLSVRDIDDDGR